MAHVNFRLMPRAERFHAALNVHDYFATEEHRCDLYSVDYVHIVNIVIVKPTNNSEVGTSKATADYRDVETNERGRGIW
jgi:hypothetical protein